MADANLNNALQNLGLDEKEASIYLALLELGKGTVAQVAKYSGIKRTNIYNFIVPLKNKNIIGEITEGKTTVLVPENPQVLVTRAQGNVLEIKNLLPQMMDLFSSPAHKPKTRFFEGPQGIKNAWGDMLASKLDICGFSDFEKMFGTFPEDWLWPVAQERVRNKQFFYCIGKKGPKGKMVKAKDKKQLRQTKLLF